MCRVMEDMRNQTLKERMINIIKKISEDETITLEKIAEFELKSIPIFQSK